MSVPASSAAKRRILVLFAHPSLERSEVNRPLAKAAAGLEGVTLVDLYAEYPDFVIDIEREQQRLRAHDVIIFLHPLYWYSTPALLKEWQELVLEHGFAYGSQGRELCSKLFFCALSAGASEAGYCKEGYNHFSIRELFYPLEQMALMCGMVYLPPFALFGARTAVEEGRIGAHVEDWLRLLRALREDRLDIDAALPLTKLNENLDSLIREK